MAERKSNKPIWILVGVFVGIPALCVLCVAFWPVVTTIGVFSRQ